MPILQRAGRQGDVLAHHGRMRMVGSAGSGRAPNVRAVLRESAARWRRFAFDHWAQADTRRGVDDPEGLSGPVEVLVLLTRSPGEQSAHAPLRTACELIGAETAARYMSNGRTALVLSAPGRDFHRCVEALTQASLDPGSPIAAGAVTASAPNGLWWAAAEAGLLATLTGFLRTRRAGPVATRQDHLVELAVLADATACARLAAAAGQLSTGPDLLSTLRAYITHDLNAAATAAALHIHRSTLEYRLRKIYALTGVDGSTVPGIQYLASLLAVDCLDRMPTELPP
ncbi:helix-turn-helix domain-containing protein [Micromonospora sp. R77]|uniref:helix-turn-helix domain-containing protein n=1 Tax=Micromonospora sp. R77 TaxID=2925836 RepID=UPI001F622875|nr:helix-turn-helix domain-containing protein [Micromonospora sp. R77]MCI4066035.1 helix-turn-helix domain-containing protein [Micromonospora sp. R77]